MRIFYNGVIFVSRLKAAPSVLLFLCGGVFAAESLDAFTIPDSLKQKIENEDAVISVEEAREIRAIFREHAASGSTAKGDTVEQTVMPKDNEWNDRHGILALSLEYGSPTTR